MIERCGRLLVEMMKPPVDGRLAFAVANALASLTDPAARFNRAQKCESALLAAEGSDVLHSMLFSLYSSHDVSLDTIVMRPGALLFALPLPLVLGFVVRELSVAARRRERATLTPTDDAKDGLELLLRQPGPQGEPARRARRPELP